MLVVRFGFLLVKFAEEVGRPIHQVEQRKHEREKDPRQNVDSFAATRKFVEPGRHEVAFRLLCMDFGLSDLALVRRRGEKKGEISFCE